jgi:SAM-dependent methyltransferase
MKKKKLKKLRKIISIDRVKGHWQYGGMRQVCRLFHGFVVILCGKGYFQGRRSKARYCPCCGWEGRRFGPYFAGGYTSLDGVCPECGSHPRHRGHLYYYRDKQKLFEKRGRLLYFAPEESILPHLSKAPGLMIETNDYGKNRNCNHSYDIMNIDADDGTFDYIICHRVIEHVVDDRKAMRELYRILKPGGIAIISVPITRARQKTLEYGSPNPLCDLHYYDYGLDFRSRIPDSFECTEYLFSELVDAETFKRLSLFEDSIFECCKPEQKESINTGAEASKPF